MIKFFAFNTSTGRVEGFMSEAARDEFVRRGYGRAINRGEAKSIMRSYILNFAAGIAYDLTRETVRVATSQSENAAERLYYYYEKVERLITDFAK